MLILRIFDYFNDKEKFLSDNEGDYYEEYKNIIFDIIIAFVAVIISYNCNKKEPFGARIMFMIFSALFSHLYLLWFVIYRIILGYYVNCNQ